MKVEQKLESRPEILKQVKVWIDNERLSARLNTIAIVYYLNNDLKRLVLTNRMTEWLPNWQHQECGPISK